MNTQTRVPPPSFLPATILGRVITALIAIACAVLGLFFFAFALLAAAVLATILAIRVWWVFRKLRAQRDKDVIEGSYSVETEVTQALPMEDAGANSPPNHK